MSDHSVASTISDNHSLASNDSVSDFSKKFECEDCDRKFATRYNLERHIDSLHNEDADNMKDKSSSEEEMSSAEGSSEEETSSVEGSSEEEMSSDEDSSEEEDYAPLMFRKLVIEAINECEDELTPIIDNYMEKGMTENEATKRAFLENDAAKKTLRRLFIIQAAEIDEQRRHPLFKAIMEKAKELMAEGFDQCEALASAVTYRKHAIYNLVKLL